MKSMRAKTVIAGLAVLAAVGLITGAGLLCADDAQTLLRQVDKELRQAQRNMFGGKTEDAIAALERIQGMLQKAKAADPNNPRVKSAQGKYDKLVKDLERRTGKKLGGGTGTAADSSQKPDLPPKPEAKPPTGGARTPRGRRPAQTQPGGASAKLPYDARRPLSSAGMLLGRLDRNLARLADPDYRGDKSQVVGNIDKALDEARGLLNEAKQLAAQKGVDSHPDIDKVAAELAAAEKKVAEAKQGHAKREAAAAQSATEVTADVKSLQAECERVRPVFDAAMGVVVHYNDLKTVEELIAKIEEFEKNDLDGLKAKLATFSQKYGSTRDEIDKKADAMGYTGSNRASYAYTTLTEGIENVAKTRTVMADDLIRRAKSKMESATAGLHGFHRMQNQNTLREWGAMAVRFDAENPRVKEFMAGLDDWIKKDTEALNAKIDKATWPPGHAENAPADADELARIAFEFLEGENRKLAAQGKEPRKMLSVRITGPWCVFKKNILHEPIQYGLPVITAVQLDCEKPDNLARVYILTMLTAEHKGVKQAPPFIGSAVGDSYYIRPSVVTK